MARRTKREQLTSVARSSMSKEAQRRFSQTSSRDLAARTANATNTLNATDGRRFVRYRTATRYTGKSRYQVESRRNEGVAVGRFVGMAH